MEKKLQGSDCPLQYAMRMFGDKWSLLIIRDIMLYGKSSYTEFLRSGERIASNILQSRLHHLTEAGLLLRRGSINNKTKILYTLTDKAIDLLPALLEIMSWADKYASNESTDTITKRFRENREAVVNELREQILKEREVTFLTMV
jgi:DNA-binding HxlR family transcriptional regulator